MAMTKTCTVDRCESKVVAKGLCNKHYIRVRKFGSPTGGVAAYQYGASLEEKFEQYVVRGDDCWEWSGNKDHEGYPRMTLRGKTTRAHRWSYAHFVAPIPDDYVIDHMCHNAGCVNPQHLRAVPCRSNAQNRAGAQATNKSANRLGVSRKRCGNYEASVRANGTLTSLGSFTDLEEAAWVAFRARQDLYDIPEKFYTGLGS